MHDEPESNTIHAAIYARVSTDDQVQGTSLESQVEACHAYARSHGLVVWQSHVFVDGGVSGTLLERPALDAMREVVRTRAVQAIIVYALDRLSRVLWHQSMLIDEWEKAGVHFHTVREKIEETPEGQLMRQVVGSFAEWERTKIRDRMMRGKAALIAKGISNSHAAPYGYRWTHVPHASTLVIDETEAEVVRQVFRWCLEGKTLRWITMELTRERIPTRRAHLFPTRRKTAPWCWNRSTIHRMVRYEGYVGRIYVGKEKMVGKKYVKQPREHWTELSIPPIIDQDTFDAVGERLTENQRKASRNSKHMYLLSSATLRCGVCGGGMGGASHRRQHVADYVYYICNTHVSRMDRSHCRVFVPATVIEPLAWACIERVLADPKTISDSIDSAQQGGAEQRMEAQRRVDSLEQRIVEKDREDVRLIEAYQGGAMRVEELKHHRQQVAADKEALTEERWEAQEALSRLGALPPMPYALEAYVRFAQQHLKMGSVAEKRAVIEKLGVSFVWTPGQPIIIRGRVPSATDGAWCAWEESCDVPPSPREVVMERMRELRQVDGLSWRQMAQALNAEGIQTTYGGPWGWGGVATFYRRHIAVPYQCLDLVPNLDTICARIQQLHCEENRSCAATAKVLNAEGVPTVSGQPQWHYRMVYRFCCHYLKHCPQSELGSRNALTGDRIKILRDEGHHSWHQIADILNAEGIPTFGGRGRWYISTVWRVYTRFSAN